MDFCNYKQGFVRGLPPRLALLPLVNILICRIGFEQKGHGLDAAAYFDPLQSCLAVAGLMGVYSYTVIRG